MGLLPEKQRDQVMVIIAVLAFGLAGVYYMYMWEPKSVEIARLQTRVDSLEARNEVARREIARGDPNKLRDETQQYTRMLALMRQLVPSANEVPTLLDQISTAARRVGLDIGEVTPLGTIKGDVFDTHRYKFGVTGPYHRIAEFLANVGSLTRIMAPMNVALVPSARGSRSQAIRPREQLLDASFEIQTYVAKTAPPAVLLDIAGGQ